MLRIESREGVSDATTKLICSIVTSVESEIVARLMLEINNSTMRNNRMLVYVSGEKLTPVQRHKNASSHRLSFQDTVKITFTLLLRKVTIYQFLTTFPHYHSQSQSETAL